MSGVAIFLITSVDMICGDRDTTSLLIYFSVASGYLCGSYVFQDWHIHKCQSMATSKESESVSKPNQSSITCLATILFLLGIQYNIMALILKRNSAKSSGLTGFIFNVLPYSCSVKFLIATVVVQNLEDRRYSHSTETVKEYNIVKARFLPSPWWLVMAFLVFVVVLIVNKRLEFKDYRISFINVVFSVISFITLASWGCFNVEFKESL